MSRKIFAMICLITATVGITACSNNSGAENNKQVKQTQKKTSPKLRVKELTNPEQASALTTYAAIKYKGRWQEVYQKADKNKLYVSLKSRVSFKHFNKGKGYIYEVSGNGKENATFYTFDKRTVYFYSRQKRVGSASLDEIISFLNKEKKVQNVKSLAKKTEYAAAITSDKYGIKGDNGLVNVPKNLIGTWYNRRGKKLVITAHTVAGKEIHSIASGGLVTDYFAQTKDWSRARIENINGVDCYHVQEINAQDFGILYSMQKKGKNDAIATYSVDTGSYTGSYWKSKKIAQENVTVKFKSLK